MSDDEHPPLPDAASVGEALAWFESFLAFRQRYDRVPGVQAAVLCGDQVRLSVAVGAADVEAGTALTPEHLFRIASHSKTFTGTTVLQLVQEGSLRLDDPAEQWVPELTGRALGRVTVRELLNHSAGVVRDGDDGDFWQLDHPFPDRDELVRVLLDDASAVLPPNERFKYSNIGYGLLGLIIEAAAGTTYAERVQDSICARLGLADLGAEYDPARAADYATGYTALSYADTRVPIDHVDTRALAAATGFHATAQDLVRYFAAHFPGDERLLSDASKRVMQHGWWDVGEEGRSYGLGLAVVRVGERTMIGHGGGYPGHITSSVVDPHAGLAVSVLTNAIDGPAEALAHAAVVLIDLAGRKPRPEPGPDLTRFTGRYASLWGVEDLAVLGGRLYRLHPVAADLAQDAAELEYVDERTLRIVGGSRFGSYGELLHFDFAADGTVSCVRAESAATLWPIGAFALPDRVRVDTGLRPTIEAER